MQKQKKDPPAIVQFAKLIGDTPALSRLGRAGARRRIEIRQLIQLSYEEYRKEKLRLELDLLAREANENICPLH